MKGTVMSRRTDHTSGIFVDPGSKCKKLNSCCEAPRCGTVELWSRKLLDRSRFERDSRGQWRRHSGGRVMGDLRVIRRAQQHRKHEAQS